MNKKTILYALAVIYTACVYGSMAMMSIGAALVGAGWILLRWGQLRKDFAQFRRSPLFWPTVVFGAGSSFSLVWAAATDLEFFGMKPQIQWVQDNAKLWHLFFPFVLAPVFSTFDDRRLEKLVKIWLGIGLASAVLGIVQHYVPMIKPQPIPQAPGYYHSIGLAGFHLSYAAIMAFPTMVALALVPLFFNKEGLGRRTLWAAGAAIVFSLATVFSYSRIAWAALPLTALVIALIAFKGRVRLAMLSAVVVLAAVLASTPAAKERFNFGASLRDRVRVWEANIEMIRQQPLFGVGWHHNSALSEAYYKAKAVPGNEAFQSHAHNNIIDQWSSTGLFGVIGYLFWNIVVAWMAFRLYRRRNELLWAAVGLGFMAGWICLQLNGLTQANFWDAKVLHQIAWVAALTMESYRRFLRNKPLTGS